MIDWDGIVRRVAKTLASRAEKDFSSVDMRRLSGSLHDIGRQAGAVLRKLDNLQLDEDGRHITLAEARGADLDDGTSIGYNLDMIEQSTGAFRYM